MYKANFQANSRLTPLKNSQFSRQQGRSQSSTTDYSAASPGILSLRTTRSRTSNAKYREMRRHEAMRNILSKKITAAKVQKGSKNPQAIQKMISEEINKVLSQSNQTLSSADAATFTRLERQIIDQVRQRLQSNTGAGNSYQRLQKPSDDQSGPSSYNKAPERDMKPVSNEKSNQMVDDLAATLVNSQTGNSAYGAFMRSRSTIPSSNRSSMRTSTSTSEIGPPVKKLVGGRYVRTDSSQYKAALAVNPEDADWLAIAKAKENEALNEQRQLKSRERRAKNDFRQKMLEQMREHEMQRKIAQEEQKKDLRFVLEQDQQALEKEKIRAAERRARIAREKADRDAQVEEVRALRNAEKRIQQEHAKQVINQVTAHEKEQEELERKRRLDKKERLRAFLAENEAFKERKQRETMAERARDQHLMEQYTQMLNEQERKRREEFASRTHRQKQILSRMHDTFQKRYDADASLDASILKTQQEREQRQIEHEERERQKRRQKALELKQLHANEIHEHEQMRRKQREEAEKERQAAIAEETQMRDRERRERLQRKQQVLQQRAFLEQQMANAHDINLSMSPAERAMNQRLIQQAQRYLDKSSSRGQL